MGNEKLRIGLVGCGRVAENHVTAIRRLPSVEFTAAAGGRKAEEFGKRHGVPILDNTEICRSELVDVVLVLTPHSTHHSYTMQALEAGKHVLVEKPVSFQPEETQDMRRVAEERGLVCMPGHSYLYLPELSRMAREIPAGGIGIPTYLYLAETYYMPPALFSKYEGPEIDVLCHQLYLTLAFLGKPQKLYAVSSVFPKEVLETGGPQVAITLTYQGGAIAQVLVSWAAEDETSTPLTFMVKALGSKGGMYFSRRDCIRQEPWGWEQMMYQESFDRQLEYFVCRCIQKGERPLSTIEDAIWVSKLHSMVLRSLREEMPVNCEEKP